MYGGLRKRPCMQMSRTLFNAVPESLYMAQCHKWIGLDIVLGLKQMS